MSRNGVSSETKLQLLVEYWKKSTEVQQHFNDISMKVRNFAVVIYSGFLTAIAVSINYDVTVHFMSKKISVAFPFAILGAFLLQLIRFMDTYWYHRFLKAAVVTSAEIENSIIEKLGVKPLSNGISDASKVDLLRIRFFKLIRFTTPIHRKRKDQKKPGIKELTKIIFSPLISFEIVECDSTTRHDIFYRSLIVIMVSIGIVCLFIETNSSSKGKGGSNTYILNTSSYEQSKNSFTDNELESNISIDKETSDKSFSLIEKRAEN